MLILRKYLICFSIILIPLSSGCSGNNNLTKHSVQLPTTVDNLNTPDISTSSPTPSTPSTPSTPYPLSTSTVDIGAQNVYSPRKFSLASYNKSNILLSNDSATPSPTYNPNPTSTPSHTNTPEFSSGGNDRYFPAGPKEQILQKSKSLSKLDIKAIIKKQVDEHFDVISSKLGINTKEKAYAFFFGMSTREAMFDATLETGSGAAHSIGALQAAESAYAHPPYQPSYAGENVPEMQIYECTEQNMFDPGIAIHSGIRHMIAFANECRKLGFTGKEIVRRALLGFNTGHVSADDYNRLGSYSDETGALTSWYFYEKHLYDAEYTWDQDPKAGKYRSNPWGWL